MLADYIILSEKNEIYLCIFIFTVNNRGQNTEMYMQKQ